MIETFRVIILNSYGNVLAQCTCRLRIQVTVKEVLTIVNNLTNVKASEFDDLNSERLK